MLHVLRFWLDYPRLTNNWIMTNPSKDLVCNELNWTDSFKPWCNRVSALIKEVASLWLEELAGKNNHTVINLMYIVAMHVFLDMLKLKRSQYVTGFLIICNAMPQAERWSSCPPVEEASNSTNTAFLATVAHWMNNKKNYHLNRLSLTVYQRDRWSISLAFSSSSSDPTLDFIHGARTVWFGTSVTLP